MPRIPPNNTGKQIKRRIKPGHHVLRDRKDDERTAFCTECNEVVKTWKRGNRFRCSIKQQQIKDYTREADPNYDRRYHLLKTFNMSLEEYDTKLVEQNYGCAICGKTESREGRNLAVDHDHKCCPSRRKTCGKCTRGLLCWECNSTLGGVEGKIEGFMRYIGKWGP